MTGSLSPKLGGLGTSDCQTFISLAEDLAVRYRPWHSSQVMSRLLQNPVRCRRAPGGGFVVSNISWPEMRGAMLAFKP